METWAFIPASYDANYPHLVTGGSENNYRISLSPGTSENRFLWRLEINGAISSVYYEPTTFPADQWVHLAGTYDGSQMIFYIDGVSVGTTTVSGTIDSATDLEIGAWDVLEQTMYTGALDEVKVWDVARSNQEVCEDGGGTWSGTSCTY